MFVDRAEMDRDRETNKHGDLQYFAPLVRLSNSNCYLNISTSQHTTVPLILSHCLPWRPNTQHSVFSPRNNRINKKIRCCFPEQILLQW